MASNPLVEAVEHFSLAQLVADPNLLRNVLNDIGAPPSEVFLLAAALDARVPQTLIEHTATNDLSVVEPRLVSELNDRGIERARAEWAVAAWKEVVGGSSLGQPTVRPTPSPVISSEPQTVRPSQPAPSAPRATDPVVPAGPSSTLPRSADGGRRRKGVIAAAVVVALLAIGVIVWVALPTKKHHTASSKSPGASTSAVSTAPSSRTAVSSSAASSSALTTSGTATPTGNLGAPLGAPRTIDVPGTSPWTDTHVRVTKGERINITATGQITNAPGKFNGPDGVAGNYAIFSILGGGDHHAALIGLVAGTGSVFLVGANYNGLAAGDGELYLGINDTGVDNNSGQYTTTIRLQQS